MRFIQHVLPPLALFAAVAALASPASATDIGNVDAFALAPVGNVSQHGIDYGLGYRVAKLGPVSISPLVDVSRSAGVEGFHLGAAATVGFAKRFDVGIAEVQRPGFAGFTRIAPSAVVGVRL
jgi:hypothetical protein